MISSILDNDLYAFTTMNAIARTFPKAKGKMELKFRQDYEFTSAMVQEITDQIRLMSLLHLKPNEHTFMSNSCYYLDEVFFTMLKGYRFDPSEVNIRLVNSKLEITISGYLFRIVLWEVPIMGIISEVYFKHKKIITSENEVCEQTKEKLKFLEECKIPFSEFGTRRRESSATQNFVVRTLKDSKLLKGTSNVNLAYIYDLTPIGTFPHLWVMLNGAIHGYKEANYHAFENWSNVYDGNLGIALTDTYTSDVCFNQMTSKQAKLFDGLRQDSGDPFEFIMKAINFYIDKFINSSNKEIVLSDSLNENSISKFLSNYNSFKEKNPNVAPKISFGIGTWLTNSFGHESLNMVIKLTEVEYYGKYYKCVKLGDGSGKENGNHEEVNLCKKH